MNDCTKSVAAVCFGLSIIALNLSCKCRSLKRYHNRVLLGHKFVLCCLCLYTACLAWHQSKVSNVHQKWQTRPIDFKIKVHRGIPAIFTSSRLRFCLTSVTMSPCTHSIALLFLRTGTIFPPMVGSVTLVLTQKESQIEICCGISIYNQQMALGTLSSWYKC